MEQDLIQKFKNIYILKDCIDSDIAQRVLRIFPKNQVAIVKDKSNLRSISSMNAHQFDESKKNLLLMPFKGRFFKRCPGARPGLVCCNYFVLNLGQHCEMNCSYCYLQNFINFPYVTIYTNIQNALDELSEISNKMFHHKLRIGTGEITDSLSLDDLSLHSVKLVNYFRQKPHWNLEFKTKSANVKNFVNETHIGNVMVSWSINPQYVIEKEEHETASLEERLNAAKLCRDKAFPVAFHFDPIIQHKNWKKNYSELIEKITTLFQPEEVAHVSLGALRFQPEQRHLMRERFGMDSLVTKGEYFKSSDGKMRYANSMRQEMFHFIISQFKKKSSHWRLFLCMENKENWLQVMKQTPWKLKNTKELFDQKPVQIFKQTHFRTS